MNVTITGKDVKVTDAIRDYVEKKLVRVEKFYEDSNVDVNVTIKKDNSLSEVAEIFVTARGTSYKAVTEDKDLYAAIDKDIDILEGQIRKTKAKKDKMKKDSSIKIMNEVSYGGSVGVENEVIKYKSYDIKPISLDDAKIKLDENKGDVFYTFVNVDTGKVNVIFRLNDAKNYGVVEPEG